MKITIVQGPFLPVPPINGGAVEKLWFAMGKEFYAQGHEVTHISKIEKSVPPSEVIDGVKHIRISGFSAPKNFVLAKIYDFIYSLRAFRKLPPGDILVTNTFFLPALPCRKGNGKLIASVERMPRGQLKFYRKSVYFRANSTPVLKAICREVPSAYSRSFMIPNPLPSVGRYEGPFENKEKTILYVGRIHPEKGIEILAEAFELLTKRIRHGFTLKIVGPCLINQGGGGEDYALSLRKRFSSVNQLEWVGPIFDEQLLFKEYQKASIFVYPSVAEKGETFGLAALEAMSQGCATIVSDLDCFKDFIIDQKNGFIFNHRQNAIESLFGILKDIISEMPDERLEFLRNKAREVCDTHAIKKIALAFIEAVKK
jgi:glycosyltransferase involved in cell wall biosynthesis